jgi:xylulokinase
MNYTGIDLGTSAVKLLLVDGAGQVKKTVTEEYPLFFPQPGWSEQNPEDWWNAVCAGVRQLLAGEDASAVAGIGCAGQMHGLVALDAQDRVIRPAILWNDGRTGEEVDYLNNEIGKAVLSARTANIAFAGFTAPKILWMRKHEPENFARIQKIMLPKDYINYLLTGVHSCDYSDASGMLLLDVEHKRWSAEMLAVCGITEAVMPALYESWQVTGTLRPEAAAALGLPETVKVVAGAGDNAAAAVGTGTVNDGDCNISVGTSGTVFIAADNFRVDPFNALHAFAHAGGGYHLMGCMLSAASCNKWFSDEILRNKDYAALQAEIDPEALGKNRVFFLPYLMGERSPVNDTAARGVFMGMSMDTTRADLLLAVLEGVAFGLRDSVEVARALGLEINVSRLCGGGAKSPLWRKMIANILNVNLEIPAIEEGPSMGGAMLAMVADGTYKDVQEAAGAIVKIVATEYPDPELVKKYDECYEKFNELYPTIKPLFEKII